MPAVARSLAAPRRPTRALRRAVRATVVYILRPGPPTARSVNHTARYTASQRGHAMHHREVKATGSSRSASPRSADRLEEFFS